MRTPPGFLTGRERAGLAYDPANGGLLLFGGLGLRSFHNDLWAPAWPPILPMAASCGGEGFNQRNELVLLDDTWIWQSTDQAPMAQPPSDSAAAPQRTPDSRAGPLVVAALGVILLAAGLIMRRSRHLRE